MRKTSSRSSAVGDVGTKVSQIFSGELRDDEIMQIFDAYPVEQISADDLAGAALAMRQAMVPVALGENLVDTCGTGGSGKKTINTSTIVAFLAAAAGANVAKHGNRSASGNCGCFDVLEVLGAKIELTPEQERKIFAELGIVFLFARTHHPAMRFAAAARKAYGKKTFFNLLGPLCNPAGGSVQLIGTGSMRDGDVMAEALRILDTEKAFVVTGLDGLDEISVCAPTVVRAVFHGRSDRPDSTHFLPSDFSLPVHMPQSIEGGSSDKNLLIIRDLADGKGDAAHRDLVLVNAAHVLLLAGLASTIKEGYEKASALLASGAVMKLMERYRSVTNDA